MCETTFKTYILVNIRPVFLGITLDHPATRECLDLLSKNGQVQCARQNEFALSLTPESPGRILLDSLD